MINVGNLNFDNTGLVPNTVPKVTATGGTQTLSPSGVTDDGTTLAYKGVPISTGGGARAHRWQEETVVVTGCSPSCSNAGSTTLTISPPLRPLARPTWAAEPIPSAWSASITPPALFTLGTLTKETL